MVSSRNSDSRLAVDLATLSVLAVDDHEINRRFLEAALAPHVASLVLARSGHEAIRLHSTQRFDIVLMDIHMPDMDGASAWERIRAGSTRHRPAALALTADGRSDEIERIRRAGFSGFLGKPVSLPVLLRALERTASDPGGFVLFEAEENDGSALLDDERAVRAAGSTERAAGLQRAFIAELDDAPGQLDALLLERRFDRAGERLHALRGAAGYVGALRLEQACRRLEQSLGHAPDGASGTLLLAWNRAVAATRRALASRSA